jgi:hypothetical protein
MKPEKLVQYLMDAARRIGYTVRIEEGNFRGGSCWVAHEHMVILNRRMPPEERADLLARVLAAADTESVYLLPEVRSFVEQHGAAATNGSRESGASLNNPAANGVHSPD